MALLKRKKKKSKKKKSNAKSAAKNILDEAFQLANRNKAIRLGAGVVNIIVYDKTETPAPKSNPKKTPKKIGAFKNLSPAGLSFWWRFGGLLNLIKGEADIMIQADSWESALKKINQRVSKLSKKRKIKIGSLQFWGHGSNGNMFIGGEALSTSSFDPSNDHYNHLVRVKKLMSPKYGSVWFRGCNTFRAEKGKTFAKTASGFFNVPVVGHTFIIWALQSGTQVLKPGKPAKWRKDQGYGRNKKSLWSDPLRKKTISCLRFYPPTNILDFVPKPKLLKITKLLGF